MEATSGSEYDVVVLGGALAGASAALLLRRARPSLRVLVVERSRVFTRRVGEATVEVSGYFLGRVLGLTRHLNQAHLVKQGFRFWFDHARAEGVYDSSEIGARYLARVPAYQVDRAVLDEEVLRQAVEAGAILRRPATIKRVELQEGGLQRITLESEGRTETITARWVVDATGVAALLARTYGWWRPNLQHPTTSVWARWKGVQDLDGLELAEGHPEWAARCPGIRSTATNHLMGDGWWAWVIPLKGGDTSVGVVFDQRRVSWPEGGPPGDRLKDFLCRHPAGRALLQKATWIEGDVHVRRNLAYFSTRMAGDGFVLVGDAAGFLDPFYSPGMDWLSYTVTAAVDLVLAQAKGEEMAAPVARLNRAFDLSYHRWFRALYRDKYAYMGDYELMKVAFVLDLGMYYLGVVRGPFRRGGSALREPVFSNTPSVPFYHLIRFYNGRLARMGILRRNRGRWGRHNLGRQFMFGGFVLERSCARHLLRGLMGWAWLELTEGWRTWLSRPGAARLARLGPAPSTTPALPPA